MRALFVGLLLLPASMTHAQEGYRLPPDDVTALLTARPAPSVQLNGTGTHALVVQSEAMPSIADVSRPMLRLAGMRIDPATNAGFTTSFAVAVALRTVEGEATQLALPKDARVVDVDWSHDDDHFTVQLVTAAGSELWGGSITGGGKLARLVPRLHTVLVRPRWLADGKSLLCARVPADLGKPPTAPTVPLGPNTQESSGADAPLRTYQDLLRTEHDADLFDHHVTAELCVVSFDGEPRAIATDRFAAASVSPDGKWILETVLRRPYSFLMPVSRFTHEVRSRPFAGGEATLLLQRSLVEEVPIDGVETGPRSWHWMASAPSSLVWVEALDGGDPKAQVPHRDRWMAKALPAENLTEARELVRVQQRATGVEFLAAPNLLITSEYDRDARWTRTLLHDLEGGGMPAVLEDRSVRDGYGDPGRLLTTDGPHALVRVENGMFLRAGRGSTPEGDLPFLTGQSLDGRETVELWRCPEGRYESVSQVLEGDTLSFVTRHETQTSPPNLRRRVLGADDEDFVALTDFPDPTPQIRGLQKRLVTYERADGLPLSATLYLPADYEPGTRLPLFVWAYPREYNDRKTAAQVSGSPHRFTRIDGTSHLVLATQGWAVLDGATMPIVGDAETMNDTFREQLVAAAQAAIDFAVDAGVADRELTAVGGHSYGAFMTANLLAHSDLFLAGVARSGAYNRTLTPFGFQAERRTFWEAPDTYFAVSPFMHADKINEPILIVHGEADNNSGTFPVQSQRLFHAIHGHGGTARLVMLPAESHGYRARESVLHVQAETIEWLDRHVKMSKTVDAGFKADGR
ncbi:MAG: prolyl oligopeptidase family serine peptidase [Planctomycetota bacterium]|nr:prolyl oligopeptidase family serine peptidase [Planctomycetota bacterium]